MSDDIPLIFADQIATPGGQAPRIVFLSAAATSQMQQFATAGWQVLTAPGFKSTSPVDLAAVPAAAIDPPAMVGAAVLSTEGPFWPQDAQDVVTRCGAAMVKVNCAFHGLEDRRCDAMAQTLVKAGYIVLGSHWRDDNTYALASLSRLDLLQSFPGRDWKRLNLIGVRDPARAQLLVTLGRLYVGEERRIADLRIANAVRGDHIARLENALISLQEQC